MNYRQVANKEIYEQVLPDGRIYGEIGSRDIKRFEDTSKHICLDAESLLDVGCCCGHWLNFVCKHHTLKKHLGIDVAENRINEVKRLFPELNVKVCSTDELDLPEKSLDVVTCLEVLEHIPDWLKVFHSLFRFAAKQVLITVPYREEIRYTVCVNCGKLTPLYGHLRSYSEDSFPQVRGWSLNFAKIADKNPERPIFRKIYRFLRPSYPWILADYRRVS